MSQFASVLRGPEQSRASKAFLVVSALVLGALSALLGMVTHSGDIDGGTTGLIVALLTVVTGSAAFGLLGGLAGWASYALATLLTLIWASMRADDTGDLIGALSPDQTSVWANGTPIALLVGAGLAILLGLAFRGSRE